MNTVACEYCRAKKCKCDKRLPACTQCIVASTPCRYPEVSKRGFPPGYISALEKRLLESELALFDALTTIRSGTESGEIQSSQVSHLLERRNAHGIKAANIAEWKSLPLVTPQQRWHWLHEKSTEFCPSQVVDRASNIPGPTFSPARTPGAQSFLVSATSSDVVDASLNPSNWPRSRQEMGHVTSQHYKSLRQRGNTRISGLYTVDGEDDSQPRGSQAQRLSQTRPQRFF